MSRTQARPGPLTFFSTCDQTRLIWAQLNDLRGRSSEGSWVACDLPTLIASLAELRDSVAMHFAHEWGRSGALHKAVVERKLKDDLATQLFNEQHDIYRSISRLAEDAEAWRYSPEVAPSALSTACDHFKMFDVLFISHESRKASALKS